MLFDSALLTEEQRFMKHIFFEKTGYGENDLLSVNFNTGIFMTRNGGHYKLVNKEVKWIKGPAVLLEDRLI
jgi:hypothetical protein